jgi:shikimate dehydrogenase
MLDFDQCINKIKTIKTETYCLIIGGQGANKARSPKIWNNILRKNKINCKMIPLEVKQKSLKKLLDFLKNDKKFLGGAIAVPYKENIYNYLINDIDIFTKKIGSVNCLFKEKKLRGINTDGIGFYETLKKNKINKNLKNILQLGYGGAGKASLVFLRKYFPNKTKIYCSTRKNLSKKIKKTGCDWIPWHKKNLIRDNCNMIVNSTSIGFGKMNKKSPYNLKEKKQIRYIYDIIYNPKKTVLLKESKKLGIKTINGLDMNLLQAHFAIKKVFKNRIKLK